MCSKLFPGTPQIAASMAESDSIQVRLKLCPPWPSVTQLLYFPVILSHLILYLGLYTSVNIPQLHLITMQPTASQVRNYYSQKNQEAHCERALAHAFKKGVNFHCRPNVWTSTQHLSIVLEIANARSLMFMQQDYDETDQEISDDDSEDTG